MRKITLKLGTYRTPQELCEAVENGSHRSPIMHVIVTSRNFRISPKPKEVGIVLLTLEDLGFNKPPYFGRVELGLVLQRAWHDGLGFCCAEVVPQMAIQYQQPDYEHLLIMTEQVVCWSEPRTVFLMASHKGGGNVAGVVAWNEYPKNPEDLVFDTWPWRAKTVLAFQS